MTELQLLLTTVGSREQALELARAALDAHLAACVQIQAIESLYRWDGQLQQEPEWRLLLKTDASHVEALAALLRERHPYRLPALLRVQAAAEADFAGWVNGELAP